MHRRLAHFGIPALILALACSADLKAGKFNRKLDLGDPAPNWTNLAGIDGKKHSLADYRDKKVLVIVFLCNHCPVAQTYTERIVDFVKTNRTRGVELVAISVSRFPADRFEKMQEHAAKSGFNFPYLYDESQKTGQDYGATCTPHFFVLDRDRRIAYMGAFDDNMVPAKVEHHYLGNAVEALLADQRPEVGETLQRGCPIDYEDD
jgi:peroxiredoxin